MSAPYLARRHETLAAAAPVWQALEEQGACTVFQTRAWAAGIVRDLVPALGATPVLVDVAEAATGRIIMLLPLVLRRSRGLRIVEWLDLGVCDYAAPLVAAGLDLTPQQAGHAWEAVRTVLPRADLIHIAGMPQQIHGTANPLALLPHAAASERHAFGLAIHGPPETMLKRLCNDGYVKRIARSGRRLAKRGTVAVVVADTPAEQGALFDVMVAQRLQRFGEMGRVDLLRQPAFVSFYRRALLDHGRAGPVRLFGISVDGEWVAACYGLVHREVAHTIIITMSSAPEWRNATPGLYVVTQMMLWARTQGLTYFDMTVGALRYKEEIGATGRTLLDLAQPLTLQGRLALGARRGEGAARAWLKRHPRLFEPLRNLRRALRRGGAGAATGVTEDTAESTAASGGRDG